MRTARSRRDTVVGNHPKAPVDGAKEDAGEGALGAPGDGGEAAEGFDAVSVDRRAPRLTAQGERQREVIHLQRIQPCTGPAAGDRHLRGPRLDVDPRFDPHLGGAHLCERGREDLPRHELLALLGDLGVDGGRDVKVEVEVGGPHGEGAARGEKVHANQDRHPAFRDGFAASAAATRSTRAFMIGPSAEGW